MQGGTPLKRKRDPTPDLHTDTPVSDTQGNSNLNGPDMEKVEDMCAQLKPGKTLMTSQSQMTKGRGEEERGEQN